MCHLIGESVNGKPTVSKTVTWGSSPCSPAKHFGVWRSWYRAWFGTKMPWVRVPPLRPVSNLSDWAMRSSPTGIYRLPLNVWLVELVKTVAPQATDRSSSLLPDTNGHLEMSAVWTQTKLKLWLRSGTGLTRRPFKAEIDGSSPSGVTTKILSIIYGIF